MQKENGGVVSVGFYSQFINCPPTNVSSNRSHAVLEQVAGGLIVCLIIIYNFKLWIHGLYYIIQSVYKRLTCISLGVQSPHGTIIEFFIFSSKTISDVGFEGNDQEHFIL